ncbi:hypothetical protein F2Q69_00019564 [Brassica cretica]|uniref:Uncharacterized protein n=1 Tax=Brassica cretica TaxID=69181 RepID=A0A8S9QIE0_BRACR|nr:hypothetical protein F2Q69_00019564 [Brassica cretica]
MESITYKSYHYGAYLVGILDRNLPSPWLLDERTLRLTSLKRAAVESCRILEVRSFSHAAGMPPPLYSVIDRPVATPPLISPEFDQNQNQRGSIDEKSFGFVKTVKMSANVKMILISYGQDYEKLLHLRKRRRKKKKKKKKKAWERREKRMQEISLLRSIPYSDHQSVLTIYSCEIESVENCMILDFGFATVLMTQGKNLKLTGSLGNRASEYLLDG